MIRPLDVTLTSVNLGLMYTIRQVHRQKLGLGAFEHYGVQVLRNGNRIAYQQGHREPVFHLKDDGHLWVTNLEEFSAGKPLVLDAERQVPKTWFDANIHKILQDPRGYVLLERDCETTADILTFGAPKYRQLKGALFLAGLGLLAWHAR